MSAVMISSIVFIPKYALQELVVPLLEIVDLVRLDSALLNHKTRSLFLEQLEGVSFATETLSIVNQVAQWFLDRNILITSLHVSQKATDLTIVKRLAFSVDTIVYIENCNLLSRAAVIDFMRACKNVQSFCAADFYNGDTVLESIPLSCSALQAIDLSNCWIMDHDLLTALTLGCKVLNTLILNNCAWINDEITLTIAENCPQLQKLSLDSCKMCGDQTLQVLALLCPDLRYLSICGLKLLTDVGVVAIIACTELRTFLVYDCRNITTNGIIRLAQGCTKLEEIGIPKCDNQINRAVAALVQHCPALNTLRCCSKHFTDQSLQHLQNCRLLHSLEINGASISIAALMQLLDLCVNLHSLQLNKRSVGPAVNPVDLVLNRTLNALLKINFEHCSSLTDAEFILLISRCPNLTELDIGWCAVLTNASVLAVAVHCKKLQSIRLNLESLSDTTVCAIVQSCPDLYSISTPNCSFLTDAAVSTIAQQCPYLKHLDISCCVEITDAGVVSILQECRQLRQLKLNGCHKITDEVLVAVVLYGARLHKLDVSGCFHVSSYTARAFYKAKPNCKLEEM